MNTNLSPHHNAPRTLFLLAFQLFSVLAFVFQTSGQERTATPATAADVAAGTSTLKYVTPAALTGAGITPGGGGTNGMSNIAITNLALATAQNVASTNPVTLAQLPAPVVTNDFNLKSYGAYGDVHTVTGVLALSNTPTITVTGGYFVGGDAGSFIRIRNADANHGDWWTTISTVNSATSITLAAAPPISYNLALPGGVSAVTTGYIADYGQHDDSMALQAFLNQETNWGGKFFAPSAIGHYFILNPPTNGNAQLVVPVSPNAGKNNAPFMELYGKIGSQPWYSGSQPGVIWDSNTTVFISNLGSSANPGGWSNGVPSSVIDFRVKTNTYGNQLFTTTIPGSGGVITNNPVLVYIHDLVIDRGFDAGGIALNLLAAAQPSCANLWVGNFTAQAFLPPPQNTNHWDIVWSDNFNGSGNFCQNINTGAGYNAMDFGLGYGNVFNFYCNSNCITSVFTGGAGQVTLDNVQITSCNNLLYGSGGGQPYYTGSGAAAGFYVPQIRVTTYQTTLTGGGLPYWMTNGVCMVYDPANKIDTGSTSTQPGHVTYPFYAGSGANAWVNQGASPNVFCDYNLNSGAHVWSQPQAFQGPVTMTNGLFLTNAAPLVLGSGIGAQAYSLQMYSPGDYNYQEFWPSAGRYQRWLVGTDDRPFASAFGFTNCLVWYPYQGPLPGLGGYGPVMALDPLGNLVIAGTFTGNASGLTNPATGISGISPYSLLNSNQVAAVAQATTGGGGGGNVFSNTATTFASLITTNFTVPTNGVILANLATVYNVKAYGALGNSNNDDTLAISNTIAAIPGQGGALYFPSGQYRITTPTGLWITKPLTVYGDGCASFSSSNGGFSGAFMPAATQILYTNVAFVFATNYAHVHNIAFNDILPVQETYGAAIQVTNGYVASKIDMDHCSFWKGYRQLDIFVTVNSHINYNLFENPAYSGIRMQNVLGADAGDNDVSGNYFGTLNVATNGFEWWSSGGLRFQNNKVNGPFYFGSSFIGTNMTSPTSVFICSDNSFENFTHAGVDMNNYWGTYVGPQIMNNEFYPNNAPYCMIFSSGISSAIIANNHDLTADPTVAFAAIQNSGNFQFQNNQFLSPTLTPIAFTGSCSNILTDFWQFHEPSVSAWNYAYVPMLVTGQTNWWTGTFTNGMIYNIATNPAGGYWFKNQTLGSAVGTAP